MKEKEVDNQLLKLFQEIEKKRLGILINEYFSVRFPDTKIFRKYDFFLFLLEQSGPKPSDQLMNESGDLTNEIHGINNDYFTPGN